MKVLIIGSGGREHALAWKLSLSPLVNKIYIAPGNGGTSLVGENVDIDIVEVVSLAEFARDIGVDLVVIGPELPLSLGLVDELRKFDIATFGPTRNAAQIETSKAFAKEFMIRNHIPTARFKIAATVPEALKALSDIGTPCVIKADGLAAGKGAFIVDTPDAAKQIIEHLLVDKVLGDAGKLIIIEEYLTGLEASFMIVTDGYRILPLATSQDFKRALDGDEGPNTGGMGAFSPAFFLSTDLLHRILQEIMKPAVQGLEREGRTYTGVLYAGLMLTREGPRVLEFNARLGDPEAQAVLPRLDSDFAEICLAAAHQELHRIVANWNRQFCFCVVLASGGYPGRYDKGFPIEGLEEATHLKDVIVFHAGTQKDENMRFKTAGGRVLNIIAMDINLKGARDKAYEAVSRISFQNMHYRRDIGERAVKMLSQLARKLGEADNHE